MSDESSFVTREDIDELNRATFRRTAHLAQIAGSALVVVGAVCVVAWAWLVIRQQLRADDGGAFTFDTGGRTSFAGRIDIVAGTLGLAVEAAMAIAVGTAIRMVSAFLLSRAGESLTTFEVGDPFPGSTQE